MFADLPLVGKLFNPRSLAAMTLLLGVVSSQGGRGTLAYFTATTASAANTFVAGKLSLTQSIASGTGSVIQWNAAGISTASCALDNGTGLGLTNPGTAQPMVPGTYCVGMVTVTNTGTVDAWLRLRLHLTGVDGNTTGTSGTPAVPAAASQKLLDKMQFSLFEMNATSSGASSCAVATITPTVINAADAASIPTDFAEVYSAATNNPIRREPIGTGGLLGASAQAQAITADTTVSETYAANTFYNLIGDDAVSAIRATGAQSADLTRAGGATPTRWFCAVFHFPNGGTPANNTSGDNQAVDGNVQFQFHYAIAQKSGRGA